MEREPVSREISDSMRFASESKVELEPDQELIKLLEKSGKGLIEHYNGLLGQSGNTGGHSLRSILTPERQLEIIRQLVNDVDAADEWKEKIEERERKIASDSIRHPEKAQWATIATTPQISLYYPDMSSAKDKINELRESGINFSVSKDESGVGVSLSGCRVSFAFYKHMCKYKETNSRHCRFCGLSSLNNLVGDVEPRQQLLALEDALESTKPLGNQRTVFEILPDGSFLNNFEVPEETRHMMMKRLSQEKEIHQVAVETRPEYCKPEKVRQLLSNLRPDQQLNIYFGLETTDDFISGVVHRKGYGFEHFKKVIRDLVDNLTEEEKKRLQMSAYNIIKSIYLTEQESVDSALRMAEDIKEFSEEIGVRIDVKYEPSVVSAGTYQDFLYHQVDESTGERRFKPLSYFSVAELLARLAEKGLAKTARFGQRDDIDNFSTVSMVSQVDNENLFSQFDFMIYNAVQRYNTTRDLRGFLVDMMIPIQYSEEFKKWELEFVGKSNESALAHLLASSLEKQPLTKQEQRAVDFQRAIWRAADCIEYNKQFSALLRRNGRDKEEQVKEEIKKILAGEGITEVFNISDFLCIDTGTNKDARLPKEDVNQQFFGLSIKAAFQIEIVILNEDHQPQSIWVKVPLMPVELPSKPDFIYT